MPEGTGASATGGAGAGSATGAAQPQGGAPGGAQPGSQQGAPAPIGTGQPGSLPATGQSQAAEGKWFAGITDPGLRGWAENSTYDSPESQMKAHMELEKLLGKRKDLITWPKDEKDTEGWKTLRTKLGVPEKPEDYGLTLKDAAIKGRLEKFFHEKHVPKSTGGELIALLAQEESTARANKVAAVERQVDADDRALQVEWGDKYAGKIEAAKRAVTAMGLTPEQEESIQEALGGPRAYAERMAAWGEMLSEDNFHGGTPNASGGAGGVNPHMSPEAAQHKIGEMFAPKSDAARSLFDKSHPDHAKNREIYTKLQGIAHPGIYYGAPDGTGR